MASYDAASNICQALDAGTEFVRLTTLVAKSLFSLVSNFQSAKDNVSGPIAIVGVGAEVMRGSDISGLFQFASVININLAVVNILPLPALDGAGPARYCSPRHPTHF